MQGKSLRGCEPVADCAFFARHSRRMSDAVLIGDQRPREFDCRSLQAQPYRCFSCEPIDPVPGTAVQGRVKLLVE